MKEILLPGFMLGVCTAGVAQTLTCQPGTYLPPGGSVCLQALPGNYVPNAGATAQIAAPAGSFVSVFAATAATPAPPGTYVPGTGATTAVMAQPGYYVAEEGATAPQVPKPGFYTATFGATTPIGAGLVASGANQALAGARQLLGARPELAEDSGLAVAALGARRSTEQTGVAGADKLSTHTSGIVLQAQWQRAAVGGASLFAGWAEQRLSPLAAGSARSEQWLVGASRQMQGVHASLFAGQARAKVRREISELPTAEQQEAAISTQVFGVQAATGWAVPAWRAELRLAGGATRVAQKAFVETGSAGSAAGLSVQGWKQVAVPASVTLHHDLGAAALAWGLRADLNGSKALRAAPIAAPEVAVEIPVAESATRAFVGALSLKGVALGGGLRLSGALAVEAGPKASEALGRLTLNLRW